MLDATIIGAGPAGCVAAILLARRGRRVALVEQQRFPRDKVCGECLSSLGIEVLERLALREAIALHRPTRLARTALVAPSGTAATIDLPRAMWGISRAALDTALLEVAKESGAQLVQPGRCESIDAETRTVAVRHLATNETITIESRAILLADGKAACGAARPAATSDLGIKAHFADVDDAPDTISLFGLRGHYVGLAAIEGLRWNVAMSVPAARVKRFGGDLNALFQQCVSENAGLAHRFRAARRITDWLASPLPRFPVARAGACLANVVTLGNAAAALEPIGGEGMGLAMRSAELAAEAVDAALTGDRPVDQETLRNAYDALWRRRRVAARAAAVLISSPRIARVTVAVLRWNGSLALPALAPLGKL